MTLIKLDRNLEVIILAALRYALPRTTFSTEIVADIIEENWHLFTNHMKHCIHEDIKQFYGQSFAKKEPWTRIMSLKIDDKKEAPK